jgi:2-polyprenyl-3-methyl-5-hydroxy-6-metoxy-1,4-benzoquinol methylase
LRKLWRLAVDRPYRHMMWLHWRHPANAFQPYNDTQPDRYPRIFEFVQRQLSARSDLRILSFGCSTGEEVFSLRRYFPQAAIKGIDVNAANIEVARARLARDPDAMLLFEYVDSTTAEAAAVYDAIFCMAVLRHGDLGLPGVTRCDHLVSFADFATMVADFSRCLKPGGLLVIRHSNFRLCDTPTSAAFATVLSLPTKATKGKTPLFGPDNKLLAVVDYPDTVFRKIALAERRP